MDEQKLIYELNRLYEYYGVNIKFIQNIPEKQIAREVKGILANLENQKKCEYTMEDSEVIKDIYFYYC